MIDFLWIILFLINGVHNINTDFHAEQGDFKYVVSIQLSGAHLCTGTIIDETHILTIAHVFIGIPVSQLSVAAGMSVVIYPFFTSFPVRKIFSHPEFRRLDSPGELVEDYWVNDIAILRLAERFHWNNNYAPVQFMEEINLSTCPDCVMISWTHPQRDSAEVIQTWNFVYSMSEAECLETDIHVLQNETCFDDLLQNSLITSSKLGSPIICDGVMIGIAVRVTENRAPRTPSTFLNVLPHSEFIKNVQTNAQTAVAIGEFSYIVSIWDGNYHRCGGFILDETHILTARHCVRKSKKKNLKVASGYYETSYLSVVTKWSSVLHIRYHSKYRANESISDDIAVLVLAAPLIFGLTVNPLQYNNAGDVSSQSLCQSFHWKRTITREKYERITVKLMTTHVTKVDNEKCRTMSVFLNEAEFCAGNPYYMHIADTGDIGNPVICDGEPVGMMVGAFPMNDKSPPVAIFLKLHLYEEFISFAMSRS